MLDQHLIYSDLTKQMLTVHAQEVIMCKTCKHKLKGILFLRCILAEGNGVGACIDSFWLKLLCYCLKSNCSSHQIRILICICRALQCCGANVKRVWHSIEQAAVLVAK